MKIRTDCVRGAGEKQVSSREQLEMKWKKVESDIRCNKNLGKD